jgi:hypothetical protein
MLVQQKLSDAGIQRLSFITNAKVKELMHTHLHIPEDKMTVVTENDISSLAVKPCHL